MTRLDWPEELARKQTRFARWVQPGSNICLDFHGDPLRAKLVVFSDGNHHMALMECLGEFLDRNEAAFDIFYATTPPGPIVRMLRDGGLTLGNLVLSLKPHVFICPPNILDCLVEEGYMTSHYPLARNQGNVILVRKDNPKGIRNASDLMREDIRLFLSNPFNEKASYTAYYDTLKALCNNGSKGLCLLDAKIAQAKVVFGERIHHREAPQAVADGSADAAMVFYHLALRYLRIFPDLFDAVPLGGTMEFPEPLPGNVVGDTHMGLIYDGGEWGSPLIEFLKSDRAKEIYRNHGLLPAQS